MRWDAFTDQELYDLYVALSETSARVVSAHLPIVEEARAAWTTRNTQQMIRSIRRVDTGELVV